MRVIKFGGTSLGTPERFSNAANIIIGKHLEHSTIAVLSAIEGTTDSLLKSISFAVSGSNEYLSIIDKIKKLHNTFLNELVNGKFTAETSSQLDIIFSRILVQLQGVFLLRECTSKTSDSIISNGEYLSCRIMEGTLKSRKSNCSFYDAKNFIRTDSHFGDANVNFEITDEQIRNSFKGKDPGIIPIVNGFTGSDEAGSVTTLGRSGSDFTATILGAALHCETVEIWTDVNGVLTADPKIIDDAVTLDRMSYDEISKLSILGAKVVHSKAMEPVEKSAVPVLILNSFNPSHPGTLITAQNSEGSNAVRSITYLSGQTMICTNNFPRKNNHAYISRVFGILSKLGISVSLGGQSSYDNSYCFVTDAASARKFLSAAEKEFALELSHHQIGKFSARHDVSIISIIVSKFGAQNIPGRTFETLFENQIENHLLLNGPGSSVVSFVADSKNIKTTISALHNVFFGKKVSADVA